MESARERRWFIHDLIFLPMLWKGSRWSRAAHSGSRTQRILLGMAVFAFGLFALWLFAEPVSVLAQTTEAVQGVDTVGRQAGIRGTGTNLFTLIGRIIYAILGVLGLVLLGYLLYAGFLWMTAGDNAEKIEQARRMIQNAVIGLVIIGSSFAITAFILSRLNDVSTGGGGSSETAGGGLSFPSAAGALGNGIIEYHLPARDATGVPRNTSIIVTFKEPIRISSLVQGYDDNGTPADLTDDRPTTALNAGTLRIVKRDGTREETLRSDQVDVRFTEDRKTFVFKPREWLGSPTVNTSYRVDIMPGRTGLLREDGSPAFGPESPSGYRWPFEVSTVVDLTPPRVLSVIPLRGVHAPNVVIQINFNEAIDPTSAAGIFRAGRGFSNIEVSAGPIGDPSAPVSRVEGEWKIANRYQTVEFTTDDICGQNACGREVRCLPRSASISVLAKSAQLSTEPPQARIVSTLGGGALYDGIVDVASNSLDGNGDGTAQGPTRDHVNFAFGTGATVDLTPPRIETTIPPVGMTAYPSGSSNLDPAHEPQATFGSRADAPLVNILQGSTVNSSNVYITRQNEPPEAAADTFWFTAYQTILNGTGAVAGAEDAAFGRVGITHRPYARPPRGPTGGPAPLPPVYAPVITSGVQNLLQNCFKPSASAACPATVGGPGVPGNPNCCDNRPQSAACSFSRRTP